MEDNCDIVGWLLEQEHDFEGDGCPVSASYFRRARVELETAVSGNAKLHKETSAALEELGTAERRIAELEAQLAEERKVIWERQSGWIKLCAAIVRMPTVVDCHRHRNGPVEIDIDDIRQRLISVYYGIEARWKRAAIDEARTGKG